MGKAIGFAGLDKFERNTPAIGVFVPGDVLSEANWAARPSFIEGVDRPVPLLYVMNGGETNAKLMLGKKL